MSKLFQRRAPLAMAVRGLVGGMKVGPVNPDWPSLLCMNRAVLASDLAALEGRAALNVHTLQASEFEAMLARFVPKPKRAQMFFMKTYAEDAALRARMKAAVHLFLDAVTAKVKVDAIVAGNTDYWQDAPLIEAAAERGLPFLVLCRENYAVPETQLVLADLIRQANFTFRGDAVAVASDLTRDLFLETGAYTPEQARTTGWPRFDVWTEPSPYSAEDRDMILMVSYHEPLYLGPENYIEALRAFIRAAKASGTPGRFCLKLKKISHLRPILKQCPGLLTSGVKIAAKEPMADLLRRSRMVIGYNTTGVLEAYLTDAAVVVPWWKDAVRPAVDTLISAETPEDRATTHFPDSPDALSRLIEQAVAAPLPVLGAPEERLSRFQRFVAFDPERSASSKFEAMVRDAIATTRADAA